ncbi:MAG: hypothetical protein GY891_07210, partial [Bacteroidetes bacterium]|nr:hypothetical protein [Bacteroidota bacterium]
MESFSAETKDNFVKLDWVSRVEFENAGYEIQRSRDSLEWETVDWVNSQSQGNSTRRLLYSAFDTPPQRGEIYTYRLKQVDNDSCYNFFGLDTAFVRPNEVIMKLFPTPTERFITLKIYYPRDKEDNKLSLFALNSIGQIFIRKEDIGLPKGWTTFTFDLQNIASGIHYFHVTANSEEAILPFVLAHY